MIDVPLVLPLDGNNQVLVDNVHPADWTNPAPAAVYHLAVVGGGTAGLTAAIAAAELGARVALVERHLLGGERLNSGCVPAQAVLRAARAWKEARRAGEFGLDPAPRSGDFATAMQRMRRLRAELSSSDSVWRLRDLGIDVFIGAARFAGPDALDVDGTALRFRRALIATGTRWAPPTLPGLVELGALSTESVFALTDLPRRLAVLGDGARACELAQAFARFGSQVSLLLEGDRLLPAEEPEGVAVLQQALEADGVRVQARARLLEVQKPARSKVLHFEVDEHRHQLSVDEILAIGTRLPNVELLGLEAAGVAFGRDGVVVDDRLRTTNPRIYACGDVASGALSVQAAGAQARLAVDNALLDRRRSASSRRFPTCVHSQPELARVGATAAQLEQAGVRFRTLELPVSTLDRARLDGVPDGLLRLHYRKGSDRILGATLVSEHAGETIGELALALEQSIGLARLAEAIRPYPTHSELIRRAGEAWRATRLTAWRKRLLALRFRHQEKGALRAIARGRAGVEPSGPGG